MFFQFFLGIFQNIASFKGIIGKWEPCNTLSEHNKPLRVSFPYHCTWRTLPLVYYHVPWRLLAVWGNTCSLWRFCWRQLFSAPCWRIQCLSHSFFSKCRTLEAWTLFHHLNGIPTRMFELNKKSSFKLTLKIK